MSPGRVEQGPPRGRGLVQKADGYADYAESGGAPGAQGGPLEGPVPRRIPPQHRTPPKPRRQRSIRSTITMLLILPLVTLVVLLTFAFIVTIPGAEANHANSVTNNVIGQPLEGLLTQLNAEEALTYTTGTLQGSLKAAASTSPRQRARAGTSMTPSQLRQQQAQLQLARQQATALATQLKGQRAKTDTAISGYEAAQAQLDKDGTLSPRSMPTAAALLTQLKSLPSLRAQADNGGDPLTVLKGYITVLDAIFPFTAATANAHSTIPTFSQSVGTILMGQALMDVATELALSSGAAASGGTLSPPAYQLFTQTVQNQRQLEQTSRQEMIFEDNFSNDPYLTALASPQFKSFQTMEDKIIAGGPTTMSDAQAWEQQTQAALGVLTPAATAERVTVTQNAQHDSDVTYYELFGIGGGGAVLVLISFFLLVRFGGRISRELRALRAAARGLAFQRLPSVVNRLRVGEDLDPVAEAPPLYLGTKTLEVTETAEAFSEVQRTAMQAAIEQAMLRKAVSNVFRRLARRNQGLLQRQLKMLDEMERGTQDPDALGQLFRLDHLTTRMRRQAEGLIILSGAAPGRTWRKPVPVVEVLRGAISEIEDYVRVDLSTDSPDYLQGAGAADVTHLLAELIENAVTYSPPSTRVRVSGGRVANGYVVEIEDRGLGIQPEALAALNQRLAEPPEFDVADSDQLGLFVVSRLADKQGIKVSLRPSNYGGTTAIVLLPPTLVVSQEEAAFLAAQETASHSNPGGSNSGGVAVGGRGRVAAAMGAAADVLSARWRSRTDTGGFPAVGTDSGPISANPGGSGQPTRADRLFASGPLPVRDGGKLATPGGGFGGPDSGGFAAADSGGFPAVPGAGSPGPNGPGLNGPGPNGPGPNDDIRDGAGLPRRQRMANMAPQLREQRPDLPTGPLPGKSPEQARALLSNIQRGLRSGRNAPVGENDQNRTSGREMR